MKFTGIENSIFDAYYKMLNPSNSFGWQAPLHGHVLDEKNIVYCGILQEIKPDSSSLYAAKYFIATTKALYRFPSPSKKVLEAVLPFQMSRLELFKDNSLWKYGFSLTAHEIVHKFIADSKEETVKWYTKLKKQSSVTQLHITKSYKIGNTIKRGGYYKLQMATNNDNKGEFLVKSMLKSHFFENPTSMVILFTQPLEVYNK